MHSTCNRDFRGSNPCPGFARRSGTDGAPLGSVYIRPEPIRGMDRTDTALLGVAGVVAALVLAIVFAAGALFGLDESVIRPIRLLAVEPFAWIVVGALIVAVIGHAYIDG